MALTSQRCWRLWLLQSSQLTDVEVAVKAMNQEDERQADAEEVHADAVECWDLFGLLPGVYTAAAFRWHNFS